MRERGFTYIGLLALVVLIGILLARAGEVASTSAQRERETELLFIGHQYREAIARFYVRTRRFPLTLEELVGAADGPTPQRYLRRLYPDPMTGAADWLLLPAPGGGISGVASSSARAPLKTDGFEPLDAAFAGGAKYSEWAFNFDPRSPLNRLQPGNRPPSTAR